MSKQDTPNTPLTDIAQWGNTTIAPGESAELRRADFVAKAMSQELQPRLGFELYWSQDRRDVVIDEIVSRILKEMAR